MMLIFSGVKIVKIVSVHGSQSNATRDILKLFLELYAGRSWAAAAHLQGLPQQRAPPAVIFFTAGP